MAYISLILAIVGARFFPGLSGSWGDAAFRAWYRLLGPQTKFSVSAEIRFYLVIAVPVIVLALGLALLHSAGWRFAVYVISFFVLLCCFGISELRTRIAAYVDALSRDDIQGAYHDAFFLGGDTSNAENWSQLHRQTLRAIAWGYFQCYFPVIFWFVLLGAPGALLYRLLCLHQQYTGETTENERLRRLVVMLEWLPLHLLGLSLALVGNWQATIVQVIKNIRSLAMPPVEVLECYILAALHGTDSRSADNPAVEISELEELPELVDRALVSWIAVLGVVAVI